MRPLAIDLYCGLGGWTEGLLAEGYRVVGFDVERHVYGDQAYPAQLVLQDVLTLHGRQFKDAALIVASPPCQAYSYRAMPWKRAKALPPPDNSLFEACFRIQREACEAAGRHIPLVVENVRGAQKWVGRSRWHFGSFHLWGDVPALMPMTRKAIKVAGFRFNGSGKSFQSEAVKVSTMGAGWYPPGHPKHVPGLALNGHAERAMKNTGGSWFNIGSPGQKEVNRNPVHEGVKVAGGQGRRTDVGKGARFTSRDCDTVKNGGDWLGAGKNCSLQRRAGSKSSARKAASAMIAKIPLVLARHIARAWKPDGASPLEMIG